MKHGHHIPASDRDAFAKLAARTAESLPKSEAIEIICGMFDVSEPTARNLISRGRYLAAQAEGKAA
jgi:hypothetical protein